MAKSLFCIIVIMVSIAFFSGCASPPEIVHTEDLFALNTFLTLRAYGSEADEAIEKAIERIQEIESRMSITIEDSDVAQINQWAGIKPMKVHDDTFYVIKNALHYSKITDGKFDITIYPIARLWGIGTENARVPEQDEIISKLPLVDFQNVVLNEEDSTVFLRVKGMGIDLGGISKGYAADEVRRIFIEHGVKHAIINMGGSITTVGNRIDNSPWRIGVRNPRSENSDLEHIAVIEAKDLSILSAGDYERFIIDVYRDTGIRYHHIFDPDTGYPAVLGVIATTVASTSAMSADALSTAMLVMGADKGIEMLQTIEGAQGLVITEDRRVILTQGFEGSIEFTDPTFSVAQ